MISIMEKFFQELRPKYVLNRRKRVGEAVCFIFLSANEILLEPVFEVSAADGSCGHS